MNQYNNKTIILIILFLIILIILFHSHSGCCEYIEVQKLSCQNHLTVIGSLAMEYAELHDGWLPLAKGYPPKACDSLQLIINEIPYARETEMYICLASPLKPAKQGIEEKGFFELKKNNLSYTWISKSFNIKNTLGKEKIISCDNTLLKHSGEWGINILYSNGKAKWMTRKEIEDQGGLVKFLKIHDLVR